MKYFAGWGTLLEQCFDELCHCVGQRPDYICDNSHAKQGKAFRGIPCISFDAAKNDPEAEFFITVRKHRELTEQIRSLGFNRIHLAHFDRGYHKLVRISPGGRSPAPASAFPADFFLGKKILVTGASRGLGADLAGALSALGSDLVLHARTVEHLEKTLARCSAHGHGVRTVAADLEHSAEIEQMFRELTHAGCAPDIVYNNAGYSPPLPDGPYSISPMDFERCFRINALAPMLIANTVIPGMLARGFGRVVNVSTALQYQPLSAAYATSKAALDKFVSDLAPTLDGTGVAINLIDPGSLETDMNPGGLYPASSALNGLLLAALYAESNGRWLSAQDYSNLSRDDAHSEAIFRLGLPRP